ncbi:MAG: four helix bundle protein [Bacteroidales bacterium]|nr:four helix bundle protein [Bacteroidales bacterium]
MRNFREYDIWQGSIKFAKEIHTLTSNFPSDEKFGLISQIRRASVSIASNIAEGSSRTSEKEFAHFLEIAIGSSFEVETQLFISKEIGYIKDSELTKSIKELHIIQKQINALRTKLRSSSV